MKYVLSVSAYLLVNLISSMAPFLNTGEVQMAELVLFLKRLFCLTLGKNFSRSGWGMNSVWKMASRSGGLVNWRIRADLSWVPGGGEGLDINDWELREKAESLALLNCFPLLNNSFFIHSRNNNEVGNSYLQFSETIRKFQTLVTSNEFHLS